LQKLAPAGGAPHVPTVCPEAIVHTPPQQSAAWLQTSPFWMQNDDAIEQRPPVHRCEQQSDDWLHALPEVLHDALSALQVPPEQFPPQHCALVEHAWPSEVQAPAEQAPLTHESVQHSVAAVQVAPVASQFTGAPPRHMEVRGSHCPEQQSGSPPQWAAASEQWAWPPSAPIPLEEAPPQLAWMDAAATRTAKAAQTLPSQRCPMATAIRKCGTSSLTPGKTRDSALPAPGVTARRAAPGHSGDQLPSDLQG
jgi:hypothetical protein